MQKPPKLELLRGWNHDDDDNFLLLEIITEWVTLGGRWVAVCKVLPRDFIIRKDVCKPENACGRKLCRFDSRLCCSKKRPLVLLSLFWTLMDFHKIATALLTLCALRVKWRKPNEKYAAVPLPSKFYGVFHCFWRIHTTQCLKITQNVSFEFWHFWHFQSILSY